MFAMVVKNVTFDQNFACTVLIKRGVLRYTHLTKLHKGIFVHPINKEISTLIYLGIRFYSYTKSILKSKSNPCLLLVSSASGATTIALSAYCMFVATVVRLLGNFTKYKTNLNGSKTILLNRYRMSSSQVAN